MKETLGNALQREGIIIESFVTHGTMSIQEYWQRVAINFLTNVKICTACSEPRIENNSCKICGGYIWYIGE